MPTTVILTALLAAPALWFVVQSPLRRHRLTTVEREFAAHWSRLTPPQKAHVLARAGAPDARDPDAAAAGLIRRAWETMRAAGDVDFDRLRDYGDVLLTTARQI